MPINLDEAIGAELDPVEFSWTSSDVQLYHLGLGAGADPLSKRELRYLADDTPQVLPTFGNVVQTFHMTEPPSVKFPGIDIELSKVLHASEAISAPGPIPPAGTGTAVTRFTEIWDSGFASAAGFPRPIPHGLCTYGMACKALVDAVLDGDAAALGSYGARMAGIVFPGETMRVTAWKEDGRYIGNVTVPARDGAVALGDVEFAPA
jgi:MaoC like domain